MRRMLTMTAAVLAALAIAPTAGAAPTTDRLPALETLFACRARGTPPAARAACDARARHEMGLAAEPWDPRRAQDLFEAAIADDPAYAPPYFALARLALDGNGTTELFVRLKALLARAPRTPDLARLRARMEGWRSGAGSRS